MSFFVLFWLCLPALLKSNYVTKRSSGRHLPPVRRGDARCGIRDTRLARFSRSRPRRTRREKKRRHGAWEAAQDAKEKATKEAKELAENEDEAKAEAIEEEEAEAEVKIMEGKTSEVKSSEVESSEEKKSEEKAPETEKPSEKQSSGHKKTLTVTDKETDRSKGLETKNVDDSNASPPPLPSTLLIVVDVEEHNEKADSRSTYDSASDSSDSPIEDRDGL
ncbi:hypothetical protein EDB80DRAFT_693353 [Ilyonectria destructans]|nr:hypothetical protein EDB80DRAFT_693353 [Ilyonectria destructans]